MVSNSTKICSRKYSKPNIFRFWPLFTWLFNIIVVFNLSLCSTPEKFQKLEFYHQHQLGMNLNFSTPSKEFHVNPAFGTIFFPQITPSAFHFLPGNFQNGLPFSVPVLKNCTICHCISGIEDQYFSTISTQLPNSECLLSSVN
jgi:hypothetical protein